MQLMRASDVPVTDGTLVFRYSRLRAALLGVLVFSCAVACMVAGRLQFAGVERYVSYYVGVALLFCLFFLRGYITARFRADNWLAQVSESGVFLKFRSYLNYTLPNSDKTVVFVPYEEIRSAALLSERAAFADAQGRRATQTIHYVKLDLAADVGELAAAISAERAKPAPKERHWYGTTSTLYNHYPVRVISPSYVEVQWGAVPGRNAFLNALRHHVQIASPSRLTEDLEQLHVLTPQQQRQRLRELDAAGQTVLAVATARRLYGFDLAEAKSFIEGLRDTSAQLTER